MDTNKLYENRILPKFFTEQDKEALLKKINNPNETVLCPRCKAELQHFKYYNGSKTFCPTFGCLYTSERGI